MAVLVLGLQIALATQVPLAAGPPHIVLILCDDYGYSDIGYHNVAADGLLRTPNFDSLAAAGIKLENYYVQVRDQCELHHFLVDNVPMRFAAANMHTNSITAPEWALSDPHWAATRRDSSTNAVGAQHVLSTHF